MSEKDKKEVSTVEETKNDKNSKKKILIVIGIILLAIILFLLWFLNRKFDVTFDLNNGTKADIVQVKYNNIIKEKDIKTKKDLGNLFIGWYEVIDVKDKKDVLAEKTFDFKTKIKKDVKLKAVYESVPETITISFDSKGGSKVNSITINKGAELSLPGAPTYKGYKFIGWTDKNGSIVQDKKTFNQDATLYAKWEKIEEKKNEPPKKTEPKKEEPKKETPKEESISLSINRKVISVKGFNDAVATATVQNKQGNVTYSISGECVTINSSTGVITAQSCPYKPVTATVTATSKTGKTATATVLIEKDLVVYLQSDMSKLYSKNASIGDIIAPYIMSANQEVTFAGACARTHCTFKGKISSSVVTFKGNFNVELSNGVTDDRTKVVVTAKTPGGQSISLTLTPKVN